MDAGKLTVANAAILLVTAGATRYGHLPGRERNPSGAGIAVQWCCPPTRQHAGSDDVLACPSGASTAVIRTTSAAMDTTRFMSRRILAHRLSVVINTLQRLALRYLLALLAIAGIVVSVLALRVHYSTESAPCSINEKWDCGIVNHSPYAEIRGLPVAAIGIAGYLLIGVLSLLRRRSMLLVATLVGMAFALYLTQIEARVLGVWCLYCVISQGIIAVLTLLAIGWIVWYSLRGKADA